MFARLSDLKVAIRELSFPLPHNLLCQHFTRNTIQLCCIEKHDLGFCVHKNSCQYMLLICHGFEIQIGFYSPPKGCNCQLHAFNVKHDTVDCTYYSQRSQCLRLSTLNAYYSQNYANIICQDLVCQNDLPISDNIHDGTKIGNCRYREACGHMYTINSIYSIYRLSRWNKLTIGYTYPNSQRNL